MSHRKQALGKGLSALLGSSTVRAQTKPGPSTPDAVPEPAGIQRVPIDQIRPNPRQPRARFDQEKLAELASSIRSHGVLQPILVVADPEGGFTLLAGERRMRAAELAGLTSMPVIVTEATDEEMLEIALVENIQRDDLNSVEEARAYKALMDSFGWSQEQVAQRVGKSRTTVTNSLRLLKLPSEMIRDLENGRLTAGHARALLAVTDDRARRMLHETIVDQGISVREAERLAIKYQARADDPAPPAQPREKPRSTEVLDTVALQGRLMEHLGCRVRIRSRDGRVGVLEIPFGDPGELQRFLDFIKFTY